MTALKRKAIQLVEQMPDEQMLVPVLPELDYDKELAEARNKKYGYNDRYQWIF